MRSLILAICLLMAWESAWAKSEYLLTHTNESKHVIVHVNKAVLIPSKIVISEVVLQTIAMESANQDDEGMYLVASVIVNRARNARSSLEYQVSRRKQFSCWNDRKWAQDWLKRYYTVSVQARARKALLRALNSPKEGIRHYHITDVMPYWANGHVGVIHGAHVFYEGIA